ncbi:hypothetical protein C4D60_Mb08t06220 [Musa balbisiana]|uniref:Uncharacterized protein n=1 Tax=Musa balbisiana TaxID=52838 RepID=A0A4S8K1T2_MUSBA|nr:hypothetical protein C4D60_Mb08t06220 [Musa balbisiana]
MALRRRSLRGLRHLHTAAGPILWSHAAEESDLPSSTVQVLSWGRGASGQLGGGKEETRLYPSSVATLRLPPDFRLAPVQGRLPSPPVGSAADAKVEVGVSCGLFHSALLVDGKFWMWGKGDGGRLGFGDENTIFVPTLNPNLEGVRSIALGGIHSTSLTRSGEVFTWYVYLLLLLRVYLKNDDFEVNFIWVLFDEWEFEWLCLTAGKHGILIMEFYPSFMGYGGFGALGHSVYHRELLPRVVKGSWEENMTHLATSGAHTAAITETGQVSSLLGVVIKEMVGWDLVVVEAQMVKYGAGEKVPLGIEALAQEHVVHIACGGSTSAAVTDKGKLYMWGNSKDCQLGVPGLPEFQKLPVEVKFLMEDEDLGPHHVISVAVGASHATCLRSGHLRVAFRGMANPSRKRHHEDKQAEKNAEHTKVGMAEFELRLNVNNNT